MIHSRRITDGDLTWTLDEDGYQAVLETATGIYDATIRRENDGWFLHVTQRGIDHLAGNFDTARVAMGAALDFRDSL